MTAATLTTRQLNRALLARQMLLAREKITVLAAVKQLVGVQAQLARPPFFGLWTRVEGFRRDDLLDPLRKRRLVRGTAMRATLHLMAADDYVRLRGALQPMLTCAMRSVLGDRAKKFDVSALEAEGRAFFGRAPATFDAFRKRNVSGGWPRRRQVVDRAEEQDGRPGAGTVRQADEEGCVGARSGRRRAAAVRRARSACA